MTGQLDINNENQINLDSSYIAAISMESVPAAYTAGGLPCSNMIGFTVPVALNTVKDHTLMLLSEMPWEEVIDQAIDEGTMSVTNTHFVNFKNGVVSGCTGNAVFKTNPQAHDRSYKVNF
mmetsp:Transcript_1300/g.1182  ORF Transcript_1300/g.1182 Transcript_1300/m.1182 type:complete len:120 (-) Transcript_1300:790-1149(-)